MVNASVYVYTLVSYDVSLLHVMPINFTFTIPLHFPTLFTDLNPLAKTEFQKPTIDSFNLEETKGISAEIRPIGLLAGE